MYTGAALYECVVILLYTPHATVYAATVSRADSALEQVLPAVCVLILLYILLLSMNVTSYLILLYTLLLYPAQIARLNKYFMAQDLFSADEKKSGKCRRTTSV
jgi:hypothetical protein